MQFSGMSFNTSYLQTSRSICICKQIVSHLTVYQRSVKGKDSYTSRNLLILAPHPPTPTHTHSGQGELKALSTRSMIYHIEKQISESHINVLVLFFFKPQKYCPKKNVISTVTMQKRWVISAIISLVRYFCKGRQHWPPFTFRHVFFFSSGSLPNPPIPCVWRFICSAGRCS